MPSAAVGASESPAPTEPPASRAPAIAWTVPFLSRPTSPAISLRNCQDVVIENRTFEDLGPDVEAIHLENCHGVTIRNNDFARVAQAITAADSTNIRVEWNRYSDILGPHERVGLNRANFVQFDQVRGGYIGNNKGKGGDTEDIVSLHDSGGSADEPLYVEYNHFEGTDWSSESGSGIALGDGGASYSIARNNVLLNPGQVGIFIAGGTNNAIIDNVVYGEQRPSSNVGHLRLGPGRRECSDHEVSGNSVYLAARRRRAEHRVGCGELWPDRGDGRPMRSSRPWIRRSSRSTLTTPHRQGHSRRCALRRRPAPGSSFAP